MAIFSFYRPEPLLLSSKQLLICTHEAEWTPFQTHYLSQNLVAPGIEPGHLDLYPGALITRPQTRSVRVRVTLRLTVSQQVLVSFSFCFAGKLLCSSSWCALSNERTGLQFVAQSVSGQSRGELISIHYCLI
jgi:hypothetical protein